MCNIKLFRDFRDTGKPFMPVNFMSYLTTLYEFVIEVFTFAKKFDDILLWANTLTELESHIECVLVPTYINNKFLKETSINCK